MFPQVRRLAVRALGSRRLPFFLRSRIAWRRATGSWLARRPDSFTEKVRWKMLKDRRQLLRTFADKAAVRSYVERVVGPECLTELYALTRNPDTIERASLPRQFVAKVTHASGGVWILSEDAGDSPTVVRGVRHPDGSGRWDRVLTHPDTVDWAELKATFRRWLSHDYSDAYLEWAYRGLEPQLLVEELLRDPAGGVPADYKVFVLNGQARIVQVDLDRHGEHRRNLYLPDWTPLDVEYVYPRADHELPRPAALGRLVEVAEMLGGETDCVRVDLYALGDRVVFGELTNYPQAADASFEPQTFDFELGSWWKLPRTYRR